MIEAGIEIEASKSSVRREQLSYLDTNFWGELHKVEEASRLNELCPQYATLIKKPRYVQIHRTRVTCYMQSLHGLHAFVDTTCGKLQCCTQQ